MECHCDHEVDELFEKRHFRCDCPCQVSDNVEKCRLHEIVVERNTENAYNQNFRGNPNYWVEYADIRPLLLVFYSLWDWYFHVSMLFVSGLVPWHLYSQGDALSSPHCLIAHREAYKGVIPEDEDNDYLCRTCVGKYVFLRKYPSLLCTEGSVTESPESISSALPSASEIASTMVNLHNGDASGQNNVTSPPHNPEQVAQERDEKCLVAGKGICSSICHLFLTFQISSPLVTCFLSRVGHQRSADARNVRKSDSFFIVHNLRSHCVQTRGTPVFDPLHSSSPCSDIWQTDVSRQHDTTFATSAGNRSFCA